MSGAVVDTSAAMAILLREPNARSVAAALDAAEPRLMSTATVLELAIVLLARFGPASARAGSRFVDEGGIDVVPVRAEHVERAIDGRVRFGNGRHRAALNLGDCFTYGLAAVEDEPILCVGTDFALTDVPVVALH